MSDQDKDEIRTSALLNKLSHEADIENFIDQNAQLLEIPTFDAYITRLCKNSGNVPEQVIRNASIERTYGHQLFNGTRKPSRDKVIQLAFGFKMDLEATQKLLQIAQKSALYPKIKRDAAIIYCIQHHQDVLDTQSLLQSLGLTLLGGE